MKINEAAYKKYINNLLLVEALGNLGAIPKPWIKLATSRLAGENSDVLTLDKVSGLKSISGLERFIHNVLKSGLSKYAMVWIEVNGEPIVTAIPDSYASKQFSVLLPDGNWKTETDRKKAHGTDVFRSIGGVRKYIPAQYYNIERRTLKTNETIDAIRGLIAGIVNEVLGGTTSPDWNEEDWSRVLKGMSFEVKALTVDSNRLSIKQNRKSSREGGSGQGAAERRAAIKKFTLNKIQPLISRIKSSVPTEKDIENLVDRALNGEDITLPKMGDISADLNKLQSISRRLASAVKDKANYNSKDYQGRASLDWDVKYLMRAIENE